MGARAILEKTAQNAEAAARVYPTIIKEMDRAGVPVLDRAAVLRLIVQVMMVGGVEDETGPLN